MAKKSANRRGKRKGRTGYTSAPAAPPAAAPVVALVVGPPPPPITFTSPANGTQMVFPAAGLPLQGQATDAMNLPTSMGFMVNDGQATAIKPLPTPMALAWNATLQPNQYLPVGTWHAITVFAYGGGGCTMVTNSVLRTG